MENNRNGRPPPRPYQLPSVAPRMNYPQPAYAARPPAAPFNSGPIYRTPAPHPPPSSLPPPIAPSASPPSTRRALSKPSAGSLKPKRVITKPRKSRKPPASSASKKKTQGRKKINIEYMHETRPRQVSFLKRKNGVLKKAYELSVLTGCETAVVIFNNDNQKLYEFMSASATHTFNRYSKFTGASERRLNITTDGKGVSTRQKQVPPPAAYRADKAAPASAASSIPPVASIVEGATATPLRAHAVRPERAPASTAARPPLSTDFCPTAPPAGDARSMYGGPPLPPLSSLLAVTRRRAQMPYAQMRPLARDGWEYPALRQPFAEVAEFESHPTLARRQGAQAQAPTGRGWGGAPAGRESEQPREGGQRNGAR